MMRAYVIAASLLLSSPLSLNAQSRQKPPMPEPPPIPMPADRAEDSYAICSSLIGARTDDAEIPGAALWLIEEKTTTMVGADEPCNPGRKHGSETSVITSPHNAIRPPDGRQPELDDLLDDFDRHCHEHIQLKDGSWKLSRPYRLINRHESKKFAAAVVQGKRLPGKFKGASLTYSFSQVYFNPGHTLAMVHWGQFCGMLCGEWMWVVLEKRDGVWRKLDWKTLDVVS